MAMYNRYNNSWWASEGDGPLTTGPDNPQLYSRLTILKSLCGNGPLYAVETRFGGTKYGKVEVKDGRIYISSFQQKVPDSTVGTRFISFQELLSRFNNGSSELPTTVFFKMIPLADENDIPNDEDSFEIIIETKEFSMIPPDEENDISNNEDSLDVNIETEALSMFPLADENDIPNDEDSLKVIIETEGLSMIPLADENDIDEVSGEVIIETEALPMIPLAEENDIPNDDVSFKVIETEENQRTKTFIMLCSALKGLSYKENILGWDRDFYYVHNTEPPYVIEEINNGVYNSPQRKGGVYGIMYGLSWFLIQVEDHPGSENLPKLGVVVKGFQRMKELHPEYCYIQESGLVI